MTRFVDFIAEITVRVQIIHLSNFVVLNVTFARTYRAFSYLNALDWRLVWIGCEPLAMLVFVPNAERDSYTRSLAVLRVVELSSLQKELKIEFF